MQRRLLIRESVAVLLAGMAIMFVLALFSYSNTDPSFNNETTVEAQNRIGLVGAYVSDFLFQLFGYIGWALPVLLLCLIWRVMLDVSPWLGGMASLFWIPAVLGMSGLMHAHAGSLLIMFTPPSLPAGPGGALGMLLADGLQKPLHSLGRDVLLVVLTLSSFVAASRLSMVTLMNRVRLLVLQLFQMLRQLGSKLRGQLASRKMKLEGESVKRQRKTRKPRQTLKSDPEVETSKPISVSKRARQDQQTELGFVEPNPSGFKLPGLHLFTAGQSRRKSGDTSSLQAMARMLEKKLLDYRVEGEVIAVCPGPVVTQFEFEPAPGTKVGRIVALQDDLARSMSAVSVRVAGNIPGKNLIGIEIPNEEREMVFMHDVLASQEFADKRHVLPLALGVDISGNPEVADLAKMPHLLIAGTTGSGKSVSVNSMINSVLMKYTPQDLRLILVDPKMLELSMYEDIPHLLVPVVTNPHKAAKALAWAVFEMERRYRLMSEARVRNISGYNRTVKGDAPEGSERLPYIVIIIDELADLMMVAGREVEQSICRLAQKARAAGIHLILATQRPSVDVITGLIKANLPSRISFQVSARVDSRTILDQMGAEQLLGHGDMLFLSGARNIKRVHGAYVSDAEVIALVEHLKKQGEPDYREEVFEVPDEEALNEAPEDEDPRYDEAIALVIQKKQASVSMVQRHLRVGYNRACRMVERMEREGVVTAPGSGGIRKVLARRPEDGGGVIE
ncbi:MAG: DNA translocase FtsK [Mariprofundaceae bacterium]